MVRRKPGILALTLLSMVAIVLIACISPAAFAVPGDIVSSIPSPYRCSQGLTCDGHNLWVADRNGDMIYQVNPGDGAVLALCRIRHGAQ